MAGDTWRMTRAVACTTYRCIVKRCAAYTEVPGFGLMRPLPWSNCSTRKPVTPVAHPSQHSSCLDKPKGCWQLSACPFPSPILPPAFILATGGFGRKAGGGAEQRRDSGGSLGGWLCRVGRW